MERTTISMNGREVLVEWTRAAAKELARRQTPLVVELELYFSCLIKKFVHFRDASRGRKPVVVNDKLQVYLRPVKSTACTWDVAKQVGRQPEKEIDSAALRQVAPKRVRIDHVGGEWKGSYNF